MFITYLSEKRDIRYFTNRLLDWVMYSSKEQLESILEDIPEEYKENYIYKGTAYRGMVIGEGRLRNSELCSWTKEIQVAKLFIDLPIFIKKELENSDNVKGIIFKKEDEFFDFGKLCNELKNWWESQKGIGKYSEEEIERYIEDFQKKKNCWEVLK